MKQPMPQAERYTWGAITLFWIGLLLGFGLDHLMFVR